MASKPKKPTNQVPSNGWIDPESDWELRRLARMWGLSIAQARQRCYHYMGAICRRSHDKSIRFCRLAEGGG
jgi:hypothetical protein